MSNLVNLRRLIVLVTAAIVLVYLTAWESIASVAETATTGLWLVLALAGAFSFLKVVDWLWGF